MIQLLGLASLTAGLYQRNARNLAMNNFLLNNCHKNFVLKPYVVSYQACQNNFNNSKSEPIVLNLEHVDLTTDPIDLHCVDKLSPTPLTHTYYLIGTQNGNKFTAYYVSSDKLRVITAATNNAAYHFIICGLYLITIEFI